MKIFSAICLSLVLVLYAFGGSANAQTVVDWTVGHLTWNEPATGGVPTSYTVACGTTSGVYTVSKNYPIVAGGTSFLVTNGIISLSDLITANGTYFCVVSASNAGGTSAPSAEVTFQANHITLPLKPATPTGVAVTGN